MAPPRTRGWTPLPTTRRVPTTWSPNPTRHIAPGKAENAEPARQARRPIDEYRAAVSRRANPSSTVATRERPGVSG